jgi:hypothetical protein
MNPIETPLTLEGQLCKLAEEINEKIGKIKKNESECSIYLYDDRRDKYILRASTVKSYYLGKDHLNITEKIKKDFENDVENNYGITASAILEGKTIVSIRGDIREDPRFSHYQCQDDKIKEWEGGNFCEYSAACLGSVIASPIIFKDRKMPGGVVRVVRFKNKIFNYFRKDVEGAMLENIIEQNSAWIQSGVFVSQLIELGTYMDIRSLCNKAAEVIKNFLQCKGCSIFLIDEAVSNQKLKIYKCYGTTGLVKRRQGGAKIPIKDPLENEDAWYKYEPEKLNISQPLCSLTVGVIRARTCAFLDNLYDKKEIERQFPDEFKIRRTPGAGKVCEQNTTTDNTHKETESILYAPMFYCDPNDKNVDVLGVVRAVRPKEDKPQPFTKDQIHLFVSLVERLSKAVVNSKLMVFFDEISTISDKTELLKFIVANIPKYIGASECAILLREENRMVTKARWENGSVCEESAGPVYELDNPNEKGYTYYVARHRRTLLFNSAEDLNAKFEIEKERPVHNSFSGPEPHRFLGVPIFDVNNNVIAVIRICKSEFLTRITEQDRLMLERIGNYLKIKLEIFKKIEMKMTEMERYVSEPLRTHVMNLSRVSCRNEVIRFLEDSKNSERLEESILTLIAHIGERYRPIFEDRLVKIIKKFESFNKNILPEMPRYRDHFVHQMIVFLLGIVILDKLEYEEIFNKAYAKNPKQRISKEQAEAYWFLTAFFHDVAYPLQTANKWFWKNVEHLLIDSAKRKNKNLPVDSILFNADYIECIDHLVSYHRDVLCRDDKDLRRTLIDVLYPKSDQDVAMDHGIMSALMLINETNFELNDILPCASAIALHNDLGDHGNIERIVFERHPLAFLLIYCDALHEWGRKNAKLGGDYLKEIPRLVNLDIGNPLSRILERYENVAVDPLPPNLKDSSPCVLAEIKIGEDILPKIEESRTKFHKIHSENTAFILRVNRVPFWSC